MTVWFASAFSSVCTENRRKGIFYLITPGTFFIHYRKNTLSCKKICHIHRNLLLFHLNKCILGIQLVCKCAKVTLAKTGEVSNFVI